jgi:hypothetical protein
MSEEWRRLQGLYAAMSDDEVLRLAGAKGGLTEVAQQAVDAEMSARGLAVAEAAPLASAMPELLGAEDDPSLVELTTFQIAMDAETALRALDDAGIPVRMEPAMRRMEEGGPRVKTSWLTIFVERTRQNEAVVVLRKRMGLFPVLAADEVEAHGGEDGEEALITVGNFDVAADVEMARRALREAGIWFHEAASQDDEEPGWEGIAIEVRMKDMEQALEVVEAAFAED